jgi:hypothetical protein
MAASSGEPLGSSFPLTRRVLQRRTTRAVDGVVGKAGVCPQLAGLVVVVQGGREIFDDRGFRSRGGKRAPRSSLW